MSKTTKTSDVQATIGLFLFLAVLLLIYACFAYFMATENYSEGERIGFITKFSKKGRFWKSWEGELNLTQTGMNTSSLFNFSIDNDLNSTESIALIDSAVNHGWKVKITYHETSFKNWFNNRGETDYFVKSVSILDKKPAFGLNSSTQGHVIDTIYVVIDKAAVKQQLQKK